MNINEQNFIKEIRKRNTRALDYIVDNYSNLVFKIVGGVLNSSFYFQHVEECANDVFWSVWNNIESFDEEKGEFKHWIAAISKYKAIDYKRKLFKESTVEDIDDYYNLCDEISTENIVVSKENKKEVLNAINNMKDEDREIFIRRYFLYEGVENIAKIFGVNRNSIDKRLSRGRKVLKKDLMHLKGEIL
ncbi:sigma-70 family RNA polymerase sigma factor [Clostridium tetani]|uniref:RNA polymerase subunit sigma-70 n=1 Tax=Clostridium tetani TaxID=1513 RepID=A0ABY0EPK1_CLOTA|nr:sigma-70 family RNA polymerase sigma factor [Clostridium tetani]CDI49929.1 RNA polymerase factor sigma-70 [Clostridium tetani 12124569]KHO38613.1 RNA polymerase sigma70 factor [Clostridium tetani]RXI39996.1 RNA polymerase subunit sigma-70 [Clostridium tetani]RXI52844.1 RNA polymerase subunit sigma-70 [Clostridium tetani]RXI71851.1 RNA polymerase subunit sigma-70 [Clostridium tetani]